MLPVINDTVLPVRPKASILKGIAAPGFWLTIRLPSKNASHAMSTMSPITIILLQINLTFRLFID